MILGPSVRVPGSYLIVLGDPDSSVLYQRSTTTDPGFQMPPFGRSSVDPTYVALLQAWIRQLGADAAREPAPP